MNFTYQWNFRSLHQVRPSFRFFPDHVRLAALSAKTSYRDIEQPRRHEMKTGTILLATLLLGQMACDPGPEQIG